VRIGLTSRLDTIQAAILIEKLAILEDEMEARQRVAARYHEGPVRSWSRRRPILPGTRSAWAQYAIELPERDTLQAHLKSQGIPSVIYYVKPLHKQAAYERYPVAPNGLPVTEAKPKTILCLPMHAYLSEEDQDRVISEIRSFVLASPERMAAAEYGQPAFAIIASSRASMRLGFGRAFGAVDEAAAENTGAGSFSVIKHAGLSGRDAAFAGRKFDAYATVLVEQPSRCRRARGAHACHDVQSFGRKPLQRTVAQPVHVAQMDDAGIERLARADDHAAGARIELDHVERFAGCDAEAFPLADGITQDAFMAAETRPSI
jgi:hypothetical protein